MHAFAINFGQKQALSRGGKSPDNRERALIKQFLIHRKKHHEWNGEKGWYLLWRGVFKGRGTCTILTNLIHSLLSTKFSVSYRSLQEQSTSLCRKVRDFHSLQFVGTDSLIWKEYTGEKIAGAYIICLCYVIYFIFNNIFRNDS